MAKKPKKNESKRLILLDAHAILHRAYHALPDFASSKGEPTGALYGLSTMLIKIISELKPNYVVACYDLPEKTYRHEAYEAYKAGRKKADEALVAQMIRSRDIFTAFNIPIYEKPGFEADDMLGTIVEKMKANEDLEIIIASGDMDTMQLVDGDKVRVYTLKKGIKDTIIYNEEAVKERYGFLPELLPDFKGLRGDPSDNIIGIKGIGEKTATTLIQNFGSIEDIYKKLKKDKEAFEKVGLTPRIIQLLIDGEEEAKFSKMLALIRRDAPIDFVIPEKEWRDALEIEKVTNLFADLEFRALGARVREAFKVQGNLTFDPNAPIENSDGTSKSDGVQSSTASDGEGLFAPVQNIDPRLLKETSIALWVLDSNISNPNLEDIFHFAKTKDFSKAREIILAEIEKRGLKKVYAEIELPLIPIVDKMQERGVKIDTEYLKELSVEYHKELEKLQKKIWDHAGMEFNINSPKQLGEVLFDKLQLTAKGLKKTEGGAKSTRESELLKMAGSHAIIDQILEYRELQKLLSTYIDNIPHMLDERGRLHATFLQNGTTTGRMSSNNPNLQNIPIKTELGRNIRKAFTADTGFTLVDLDYSQIELRVAAFLSKDQKLIEIFKTGQDVHTAVAAQVFNVAPDKVDKEMRRRAKVINFGILYGMGVNALKQNLGEGTSRKDAQEFYNQYFETFSTLAKYLDGVKASAERLGYTETYFGRRRYFEGIKSHIPYIKASAERMAINAPIQGTQSDIMKMAMVRIDEYLTKQGFAEKAHLILQVHDELIYEVQKDLADEVAQSIKHIMETVVDPKDIEGVPIIANAHKGLNWGSVKEI